MAGANQIFLPYVQPGMAASLPGSATERLDPAQPSTATLPVTLSVNSETITKDIRLYGPGDVIGIDPDQIVRVEPKPRTTDFEPNYFPAIEFDRPDFPWLFTPAKADIQGRLRPWLILVVVRKQSGVVLTPAGNQTLPVLQITPPAKPDDELPVLAESHLWAHAQLTGADRSQIKTTLAQDPARSVSRLICPRRLAPNTEYIACVVPAFDAGVQAGLNKPAGDTLAPAWRSGNDAPSEISLPVYYSWEFRTGEGGDFEELVRRLQPHPLPADAGKRPIDISHPGFPMDPQPASGSPGTILGLEGALRGAGDTSDEWPDAVRIPFQTSLGKILSQFATESGDTQPVVSPPIYGFWYAAKSRPEWINDLNFDPRYRAAAATGTRVVQDQQEQLMASAWEQFGGLERRNQKRRQAQLSRAINERYYEKTFQRLPDETFIRIVAPAKARVVVEGGVSGQPAKTVLAQRLATSAVPPTVLSAPFRKVARPRGTISRQYSKAGVAGVHAVFELFNKNPGLILVGPAPVKGAVTIDAVTDQVATLPQTRPDVTGQFIFDTDPPAHWERMAATFPVMIANFRRAKLPGASIPDAAAKAHVDYLARLFTTVAAMSVFKPAPAADLKKNLLASLQPAKAVKAAIEPDQPAAPSTPVIDELEPVMAAPVFPQPMYEALRDLSQDLLFPGLEHVPPNTVQLLESNSKFIEAFMVGLNTEMGRELLWRGYPTDQRGTYFRRFWDRAGSDKPSPDIPPIHEWREHKLGTALTGQGHGLVLLIRGELVRRYPATVIYAVKAIADDQKHRHLSGKPQDQQYPSFRGRLDPDVLFAGFELSDEPAGWYFVLQEQPSEPRFGMDEPDGPAPVLETWDDLSWSHVAPSGLDEVAHVNVGASQLVPAKPDAAARAKWGRNSAHMAFITKQKPMRVAIHESELLSGG
jgi:hypothetical protein